MLSRLTSKTYTSTLCATATYITATSSTSVRYFSTSNATKQFDVVVIGGGPGGYVAAIKAAQLGLKTACVESRGTLGGTCLNVGCIPSKALLNASHKYADAQHDFERYGIENGTATKINIDKLQQYKGRAVDGLTKGIELLFRKNKVEYFKAKGSFVSANDIETVNIADGKKEVINGKNIIIATGSSAASLPGITVDEKTIVTSTGALALTSIPKHLVVIGGGVIGLEMGSVWKRLGSKVTVVEFADRIIPGTDSEIAKAFQRSLEKQKFGFKLSTKVTAAEKVSNNEVKLTLEGVKSGTKEEITADVVLVATGRVPYTDGLNLSSIGVKVNNRKQIEIDDHFRTNVPNVYAIGDVVPGPMLAHKAEEEGIAAAEIIAKQAGHVNYNAIPGVIYTHPEVATVGLSEDDARALISKGLPAPSSSTPLKNIRVSKFPMVANSRARTNEDSEGLVKVVTDAETDRILGVHILSANAGELIAEATLAIEYGASAEDVARTCHAHPTLSEAFKEACLEKAIHA